MQLQSATTLTVFAGILTGTLVGVLAAIFAPEILRRRKLRRFQRSLKQRDITLDPPQRGDKRGPPRAPLAELQSALSQNRLLLFGGSRLSDSAGLPTGDELILTMIRRLQRLQPGDDDWVTLEEQHQAGQAALVAELLRRRLDPETIQHVLLSIFTERRQTRNRTIFQELARTPFAGVITNQWDTTLLDALNDRRPTRITPAKSAGARNLLREGQFFALQLFGDLEDPDDLLFTVEDYREAMRQQRDFAVFVTSLVTSRTLLFVGATVHEIEDFFAATAIRAPTGQPHTALVPQEPGLELVIERMRERYGLTLLPFSPAAVMEASEAFLSQLRQGAARIRPSPVTDTGARLESLDLENIGPFGELHLDFGPDWTILLGDNASGKSTILRAIALALCGDSPSAALTPTRMLRSGATQGLISAKVGKALYRTELRREGARVRIAADTVTPVQAGAWLGLGFPPLRGIATDEPVGALIRPNREPSPEDLLPLLVHDIDVRMNDIKQWVFTTWLLAKDKGNARRQRSDQLLTEFFELLQRLTPGIDFSLADVDTKSGEILLDSPDGVISIEMLSQGISSMLAWVGVLLERLYEVYEEDDAPTRRGAIVLVDEIDAHLHPDWQRILLPYLREMFPGIQLIATTHSPLIVGNTKPGEVIHVEQHEGTRTHRRIDETFTGMRADQILTSPAFALRSTRDPQTTRLLENYRDLRRKHERSGEEERKLGELGERLNVTLPPPQETPAARQAAAEVKAWAEQRWRERLEQFPAEKREELAEETRAYLARLHDDEPAS